ncbi:unnamed protein product, partial [Gadus morhua 'NCC']
WAATAPPSQGLELGVGAGLGTVLPLMGKMTKAGLEFDHATHKLELMKSTNRPTTTTVKAKTTCTSTSEPNTTRVNAPTAGVLLRVLVLLGFSVLTLVVLLRLIGWWRTRGKKAATEECIGLNSASDAPPARERLGPGASDQDQLDPGELSDAATYVNMRAPHRCAGDTTDTSVHFVTVHQLSK